LGRDGAINTANQTKTLKIGSRVPPLVCEEQQDGDRMRPDRQPQPAGISATLLRPGDKQVMTQ
jgi:hypothetical protein